MFYDSYVKPDVEIGMKYFTKRSLMAWYIAIETSSTLSTLKGSEIFYFRILII